MLVVSSPRITRSRAAYSRFEREKRKQLTDVDVNVKSLSEAKRNKIAGKKNRARVASLVKRLDSSSTEEENTDVISAYAEDITVESHVKTIEISAEEKAMDGAPQGKLVQVEVLPSSGIHASSDPNAECEHVLSTLDSHDSQEWDVVYDAVVSIRRLCIHHAAVLTQEALTVIVPVVHTSVGNLRSTMMRNAMFCLEDMFAALSVEVTRPFMQETAQVLFYRAGSDKKFIAESAKQALEKIAKQPVHAEQLLVSTYSLVDDSSVNVGTAATQILELCLATLGVGKTPDAGCDMMSDIHGAVLAASKGLHCKRSDGRDMAKKSLRRLRRALGADVFKQVVQGALPNQVMLVAEVIKSSVLEGKGKKSVKSVSIRERMLAQQKQQAQQSAGGFQMCM